MKFLVIFAVFTRLVSAIPDRGGRIFNGRDASVGEAPYMIQFRQIEIGQTFAQHFCGGALVNPRWIVSAAHCFDWNWEGRFTFTATAAQHNWRVESGNEQVRNVARFVNHPNYNGQSGISVGFDINVVQVDSDFVFNALVGTISLPPPNFLHSGNAQAFGWGSYVPAPPLRLPDILQTTTRNIIPFDSCHEIFNAIMPWGSPLHFTDMCTGPLDGSTGTCSADSGGPLVQVNPSTGNLELVGVVAWGTMPCNTLNFPTVFARVSAFIDWINQNVN